MAHRHTPFLSILALALLLAVQTTLYAGAAMPVPTAKDKCPVCGMFVRGYPNWLVTVRLKNGTIAFFDGAKDMFTWYLHPGKYPPPAKPAEIVEVLVRDYYSLQPIDARTAYFVVGSSVMGPMGKELIPLATAADAREFMADHQGKRIYRFNEITAALLATLS